MNDVDLNIPRIERSKPLNAKLSENERTLLFQMVQSGGYAILLRLMEASCILQDGRLISVEPSDTVRIVAEQHIAVARWEFFDWIQKQVAKEVHEYMNPAPTDLRTEEEKEADKILNP